MEIASVAFFFLTVKDKQVCELAQEENSPCETRFRVVVCTFAFSMNAFSDA